MSCSFQHSKGCIQSPEELRAKEWTRLEDKILRRALALWRRRGKAHLDALSALRRAEREVLATNGTQSVQARMVSGKNRKGIASGKAGLSQNPSGLRGRK